METKTQRAVGMESVWALVKQMVAWLVHLMVGGTMWVHQRVKGIEQQLESLIGIVWENQRGVVRALQWEILMEHQWVNQKEKEMAQQWGTQMAVEKWKAAMLEPLMVEKIVWVGQKAFELGHQSGLLMAVQYQ